MAPIFLLNFQACLALVKYNESCVEDSQCQLIGVGSICKNASCLCDEFHRSITDNDIIVCQKIINHGDPCSEPNECNDYLASDHTMVCLQSRCQCRQGYELFDAYSKQCVKIEHSASSKVSMFFFMVSLNFVIKLFL